MELRDAWLEQTREEILEPDRSIVDPHFHFFEQTDGFPHYRLADLVRDTAGHRVEQAIFMQCREGFRTEGPEHLRPVGETEWIDRRAREAAAGPAGAVRIAGLIADARLCNGVLARETLEAHMEASPLFRGVRELAIWDPSPEIDSIEEASSLDLYGESRFREGFAELAKLDLVFDAHLYHTQLPTVASLARAFPDTTIVVDHLGSPLGAGPYTGKQDEIFPDWQRAIREIAACPNIVIKLGGLAMPWCGFGLDLAEKPPTSDQFVATFGRYYDHALQCFGPDRCMFESNFPVDRFSVSYDVLWNAFKKIAAAYSEDEKESLFRATATRVYRLDA